MSTLTLTAAPAVATTYRYPGIRPFQPEDTALFFGRERESTELFNLVSVEKLAVLFAKSGIGKSSLINAGLLPQLREARIFPVFVRFLTPELAPEEHVAAAFRQAVLEKLPQAIQPPQVSTLWELLKETDLPAAGGAYTPLIILDQFEELFSKFDAAGRATFVTMLSDLTTGKMPEAVRRNLRERVRAGTISADDARQIEEPPRVKILISIRSDMFHLLNALSPALPYILRSRYELQPLNKAGARLAIVRPAGAEAGYACPPFTYTEEALLEIIEHLTDRDGVESFQLQLICRSIEERLLAIPLPWHGVKGLKTDPFYTLLSNLPGANRPIGRAEITPDFYNGAAGLAGMLEAFYMHEINKLPAEQQISARRLIEDELMTATNRRRIVDADTLLAKPDLHLSLLENLVAVRLLRKETYKGMDYYEISHDALVKAILPFKTDRQKLEKASELEKELKRERRKRLRQRRTMFIGAGLLVCTLAAAVYAVWMGMKANRAMQIAEEALHKIYFYDDDYGVAYDEHNEYYYYINRLGQQHKRMPNTYQDAFKFEYNGFARVRQSISQNFLLDTLGQEYPLTLSPRNSASDSTIVALDCRNRNFPKDSMGIVYICKSTQLKILLISNSKANSIILQKMTVLKNLEYLDLSSNSLYQLPDALGQMSQLRSLCLAVNSLSTLGTGLENLTHLHTLDLSKNLNKNLPAGLWRLTRLRVLNLANNFLQGPLPDLTKLKKLEVLNLRGNRLTALPPEVLQLPDLTRLDISHNPLTSLPPGITALRQLRRLDLRETGLSNDAIEALRRQLPACRIIGGELDEHQHN